MNVRYYFFVFILLSGLLSTLGFGQASTPAETDPLALNPATGCMEGIFSGDQPESDRRVPASAIIESLRSNPCLRLDYAIIQGDLDLRTLPINGVSASGNDLVGIKGAFVITHSIFEGDLLAGRTQNSPQVAFEGPAVFGDTRFSGIDLTGVQFNLDTHFENTTFTESARLDQVKFLQSASFNGATFENPVFMNRISVGNTLDFTQASFGSLVRGFGLKGHTVILTQANFATTTDFSSWNLINLEAFQTVFEKDGNFKNAIWNGSINFEQVTVNGNADFSDSVFGGQQVVFKGANFSKNAAFTRSKFFVQADFSNAHFQLNTILNSAEFYQQALFNRAKFDVFLRLVGTTFYQLADFSNASFAEIEMVDATFFTIPPNWQNVSIIGPIKMDGMKSYSIWQTENDDLNNSLKQESYYVFADPSQPTTDPTLQKLEMIQFTLFGILAGVALVLGIQLLK